VLPDDHSPRERGLTLIEMLVVIGIIALLASLVLAVSGSVIRASEERSTRNSLELLNAATEEYERTMDRRVTYQSAANLGFPADPAATQTVRFDVNTLPGTIAGYPAWTTLARPYSSLSAPGLPHYSTRPFLRTAQLISLLTQSPSSAAIMQKIPDSVFRGVQPLNGAIPTAVRHVVDAWDTPIIAIFPGREANSNGIVDPATNVDADGTIKCDSEWATAPNGGMQLSCKNRKILWVSAGNDSRFITLTGSTYSASTDNLYSYEP
jgi:prepilin-type N-terminal cleavage/methylation domain-containing protein